MTDHTEIPGLAAVQTRHDMRLQVRESTFVRLQALSDAFDVPASAIAAEFLEVFLTMTKGQRIAQMLRQDREEIAARFIAEKRRQSREKRARRTAPKATNDD